MSELKMNDSLKEMLMEGFKVSADTINRIEYSFNTQAAELKQAEEEAKEAEQPKVEVAEPVEPLSLMQMARKARIIDPIKTEVSGSKLEMARNARIIK